MESANISLILIVTLGLILFSLISKRLQQTIITPPIVFVVFGFLLGPYAFHIDDFNVNHVFIHSLAEITLVLILFTDAARIDLRQLHRKHNLPVRLLLIGLPLTIIFGTVVGKMLFGQHFSLFECALLATILAPTDAALGQAVVSNPQIPTRIRQALNIESGLNDGIVLPILLLLIALTSHQAQAISFNYWLSFISIQLFISPVIGITAGILGGFLIRIANKKSWITHSFQDLSVLALAILAFMMSQLLHANGFIAAFFTGLALGNYTRELCTCLYDFSEAEGQLLSLLTFLIFGAVLVPLLYQHISLSILVYALLSLTVIRMLPVAISLINTEVRWQSVIFLGWFGPRGLASILFGLLLLEKADIAAKNELMQIVVTTVVLSIFLHGITAYPLSQLYAKVLNRLKEQEPCEFEQVTEMPTKFSSF